MIHLAPMLAENSLFKTVGQIFHPLFVAIADVLAYIYGLVPNYGGAIAILTVVIMALLTPLTIKSTRSMLAMQALQPEMQKLRAKYKGAENREQLNQEMMRLYREHGASPTGGCLPMFLQMPALIVLYDVIRGLANTVTKGQTIANTGHKCLQAVCATPRYIPHSSLMYQHLVASHGVMNSFGMNLASKPLTHHGGWPAYIPYFAFVLVAVGLQYFQMAQMTKRNRKSPTQVPSQMQTMQRVMPLIFAYIYFIVPAGVTIYMIISSGIRVLTQDIIFRYGIVQRPGEERIAGERRPPSPRALLGRATAALSPASGGDANGATPPPPAKPAAPKDQPQKGPAASTPPRGAGRGGGSGPPPAGAGGSSSTGGAARGGGARSRRSGSQPALPADGGSGRGNGRGNRGNTTGNTNGGAAPKSHPRSKSKRARKAR